MITIICAVIGLVIDVSLKKAGVHFSDETFNTLFYGVIPIGLAIIGYFIDLIFKIKNK